VKDARLARILVEHWEARMRASPVEASQLGDHRFDDQLGDASQAARARWASRRASWLARARALDGLGEADALTRDLLVDNLSIEEGMEACRDDRWRVSARNNPVSFASGLPEAHDLKTATDGGRLLRRYRALPRYFRQVEDNLRLGLREGLVVDRQTADRTVEMVRAELGKPVAEWGAARPAKDRPAGWSEADFDAFRSALLRSLEHDLRPAYQRFADFLLAEIVPAARTGGSPGIAELPTGRACYAASIRAHTTLQLTPETLHRTGLEELARIHDEMVALGPSVVGSRDYGEILARLRTDKALHFESVAQIVATAEASLARAKEAMPRFLGRVPATPCVVKAIPDYEAPYTYVGYYFPPAQADGKPGTYFVNTYAPETRTRYEAEALAFHESIPGHHLQVALAQELEAMPAFRRNGDSTAFVEGWALYTERLSDELGLYSGDVSRMGMLSYDAWRASRLVVDTGIHAMGWSREQAERFMVENTALAENNIRNEVDRYISWPGHALAYKTGQLEIRRLRDRAEGAPGSRFDLRVFHDVLHAAGPVPLPILRARVEAWIATASRP
jgi:uncharacterized protein (DUF885 family)